MKLTLGRSILVFIVQFTLLGADVFFNTFGHLISRDRLQIAISFFVIQDICIIIQYVLFAILLQSTCAYQVGATHIILRNCKLFLFSITTYFLLSATQHFWIVYNQRQPQPSTSWPLALTTLIVVQRMVAIIYYYTYKKAALNMSDPHYNERNIDWIGKQLNKN